MRPRPREILSAALLMAILIALTVVLVIGAIPPEGIHIPE